MIGASNPSQNTPWARDLDPGGRLKLFRLMGCGIQTIFFKVIKLHNRNPCLFWMALGRGPRGVPLRVFQNGISTYHESMIMQEFEKFSSHTTRVPNPDEELFQNVWLMVPMSLIPSVQLVLYSFGDNVPARI